MTCLVCALAYEGSSSVDVIATASFAAGVYAGMCSPAAAMTRANMCTLHKSTVAIAIATMTVKGTVRGESPSTTERTE